MDPTTKNKKKNCRRGKYQNLNWPVPRGYWWSFPAKQGDDQLNDRGHIVW